MGKRARKAGLSLESMVKMAAPLLQKAERENPRKGPGAKPEVPDWVMGLLIMIAVVHGKKSKLAQFHFLSCKENCETLEALLGQKVLLARSGWYRRYGRADQLYQTAIWLQGKKAEEEGIADPQHLAADKSMIAAQGRPWHKSDRKRGKAKPGVDRDAGWGRSKHDGWVYGYSYDVVVTSTVRTTVFPLLASVDVAGAAEAKTFAPKIAFLPKSTKTISLDSGYDSSALAEQVEFDAQGRRTGRLYLCRENKRCGPSKAKVDEPRFARHRQLRRNRRKLMKTARAKRLYARRKKTVEPFNSWFKSLFGLDQKVWHRGLENNRTQILAAIFAYQLLVRFNFRCGRRNAEIKWLMDAL